MRTSTSGPAFGRDHDVRTCSSQDRLEPFWPSRRSAAFDELCRTAA